MFFCANMDYSMYASIIWIGIRKHHQPYWRSRAGQTVFANITRIVSQRGKENDKENIKTTNYLAFRQVGRHLVHRHIRLYRINDNNVNYPNLVNGTSGSDGTRHRTESVTNIKWSLINPRSIVKKTNMLQSMLFEKYIDICVITEMWTTSKEELLYRQDCYHQGMS